MASCQLQMPPIPMTGIFTARNTSHTIRTAIGLIQGPESPPVIVDNFGFLLSTSIAIPKKVLTRDTASAPSSSTPRAIWEISVTLGDNFTINVLGNTFRTSLVTWAADWQEVPNAIPPSFTLGQEIFNSIAGILSRSANFSAQATYSSTVEPDTFTIIWVSYSLMTG
ncbi:hypothetical protein SDC9_149832 [bioreactor metagenome]|uniref:Uncharacterized protein n=1 Tax=bioreactor metagenome TaxID=1076179 RepID=A0A645EME6_9ZZZZ